MKRMLKRRPSKRFVLGESGEDGAWDPTQESIPPCEMPNVPIITEPNIEETIEKSEINVPHEPDQEQHAKYLRVTTGSIKYVIKFIYFAKNENEE